MEIVEMLGAEIIADFCKDLSLELSNECDKAVMENIVKASDFAIYQKSELMLQYMKHQLRNPAFDEIVTGLGYASVHDALRNHLERKGGHTSRLTV